MSAVPDPRCADPRLIRLAAIVVALGLDVLIYLGAVAVIRLIH